MLIYKCEEYGINIIEQEESYTSKCSSLDLETLEHHDKYIGIRKPRGLFKTNKYILNSDINGSLNILRKVIGDDFINLLNRGQVACPLFIGI